MANVNQEWLPDGLDPSCHQPQARHLAQLNSIEGLYEVQRRSVRVPLGSREMVERYIVGFTDEIRHQHDALALTGSQLVGEQRSEVVDSGVRRRVCRSRPCTADAGNNDHLAALPECGRHFCGDIVTIIANDEPASRCLGPRLHGWQHLPPHGC
jgi:hypothetical protein